MGSCGYREHIGQNVCVNRATFLDWVKPETESYVVVASSSAFDQYKFHNEKANACAGVPVSV